MSPTQRARILRKNQTDAERKLWSRLRNRQLEGCKFYRQYPIYPYYADFICRDKDLIIELDGGQHNEPDVVVYDDRRTEFLERKGYTVLRFWNSDIMNNLDSVLETIRARLSLTHSANPASQGSAVTLSLKGEGGR